MSVFAIKLRVLFMKVLKAIQKLSKTLNTSTKATMCLRSGLTEFGNKLLVIEFCYSHLKLQDNYLRTFNLVIRRMCEVVTCRPEFFLLLFTVFYIMTSSEETRILHEEIENDESDENSAETQNIQSKGCHFIEPILFFISFSVNLFVAVLPNAIEVQYCQSVLNIADHGQCLNASNPNANDVQTFTSRFSMFRSCAELLIPAVLSFFLGPWSDVFGRKPLMLASSTGYLITFSLWTWGSTVKTLHPLYFILFSVPIAISGGRVLLNLALYCYICDVSSTDDRGTRLGYLLGCGYAGALAGILLAPFLVIQDYTIAFAIATSGVCIALTFLCFINESITVSQLRRNTVSKNPFQLAQLKSLYQICYVKQPRQTFLTLAFCILLICLNLFQIFGESNVFYLFLQHIHGWTLADYTPLNCFSTMINVIGSSAGSWFFTKYLKLHDLYTLAIAVFIRLLAALVLTFSTKIWHIYLSQAMSTGITGTIIRTFMSKSIAPEDTGKLFCLICSLESLMPLIGSVGYNALFETTMISYPRAVFVLSGITCAVKMIIIAVVVSIHIRPSIDNLPVPQTSGIHG